MKIGKEPKEWSMFKILQIAFFAIMAFSALYEMSHGKIEIIFFVALVFILIALLINKNYENEKLKRNIALKNSVLNRFENSQIIESKENNSHQSNKKETKKQLHSQIIKETSDPKELEIIKKYEEAMKQKRNNNL